MTKFRVWDGKKMWYAEDFTDAYTRYQLNMKGKLLTFRNFADELYKPTLSDLVQCVPMMSTGDENGDENGKDIYDGDIVKVLHDDGEIVTCQVFWCENMASFALKELDGWDPLTRTGGWRPDAVYEICGNIYENPELMKG